MPYKLKWTQEEINKVVEEIKNEKKQLLENPSNNEYNDEENQPRQSGSEEWKQERGEMGNNNHFSLSPLFQNENLTTIFESTFSNSNEFTCNGDAKIYNYSLILTENKQSQKSSCWYNKKLSTKNSIVISFKFCILNEGADGFAFVIVSF